VTPFQGRVYDALQRVPRGRVTTYALLAAAAGCGSARAVGQALRRNPFAPRVPCHRVIASDLTPGGFAGRVAGRQLARKLRLLKAEGVRFGADGRLADPSRVHRFCHNPRLTVKESADASRAIRWLAAPRRLRR
jgi:methylated-DNA-[protein]-cysteine S-methyltransferase